MKNHSAVILLLSKSLETESEKPLYRQICDILREAILSRRLRTGTNLPSTRILANELSVSRNTVMNAFDQLIAEGYLVGEQGNGTFVADELPDEVLKFRLKKVFDNPKAHTKAKVSKRGNQIKNIPLRFEKNVNHTLPFNLGFADINEFPLEIWKKILARNIRQISREMLGYESSLGYFPLREAIANYLKTSRGIECETAQVIIISGSSQGLDLTARILLEEGDEVLIEDPNYTGIHGALFSTGAKVVPISLDDEGININEIKRLATKPRALFVTPASHFPTTITMSLSRRAELLEWAELNNCWIIEDDYASEFRYEGKSVAPLQTMDLTGRVIYIGTFSKLLFPALRLGFLVVPPNLVETFHRAIAFTTRQPSILEQITLSDLISEGHFGKHLRRIRAIYGERKKLLNDLIEKELAEFIRIKKTDAGMHLIGNLNKGLSEKNVAEKALEAGIYLSPLSKYCINSKLPDALLFGFTSIDEENINNGITVLKKAFHNHI